MLLVDGVLVRRLSSSFKVNHATLEKDIAELYKFLSTEEKALYQRGRFMELGFSEYTVDELLEVKDKWRRRLNKLKWIRLPKKFCLYSTKS